MCNLEKKPCEDTVDQTDDERSSLTFMMMEPASDGFPICKIIMMKTKVKGQTGKRHMERNCSEHAEAAGGGRKAFKIPLL